MKTLILVRHGETEWNSDRRIQGSVDVPLSEVGREQAAALAHELAEQGLLVDRVYTSDLRRSRETGRVIAERLGVAEVSESPLLRELHCGEWEGRLIEELRTSETAHYEEWLDDPAFVIPGGESILQLRSRAETFFEQERAELEKHGRVLVVAHGLINRMVLSVLLRLDPQRSRYFSQDNTAIDVFTWRGNRVYCDVWNLTCHL